MPVTVDGKTTYDCTPEEFVRWVPDMLQAGTAIFGGCCGTDEDYVAALAGALKGAAFVRPAPKYPDLLPAATEKDVCYLPVDAGHGPVIAGAEHMEDGLTDALEDGFPMVAVAINSWEDVDALADCQYMISKPLCLVCDQARPAGGRPADLPGPRPVRGRFERGGAEAPGGEVWSDLLRELTCLVY